MNDDAVRKYLVTYAEQEVMQLADFPVNMQFDHCVVIPAYNETAEFFTRLQLGPLHNKHCLYIAVINQPDTDPDTETNRILLQQMNLSGEVVWHSDNMVLMRYSGSNNYWLIIDRFTYGEGPDRRLPANEGVGLARKIGCDIAAALVARSQIASGWIHSTDADVFLPKDYFTLPDAGRYSAALYRFKHQNDGSAVGEATAVYEQALDYYVRGLAWANSPYAYHTIGSILAINAETYCHVRGFPRRSGGEDFYLLNKLAKLGSFYFSDKMVRIKARNSDRVPFGTGPAVTKIMAYDNPATDYTYYHPETFNKLKEWMAHIPNVWPRMAAGQDPLAPLSDPVIEAVTAADWDTIAKHLRRQVKTGADAEQVLHNWFDAFQTLKFIRYLQAHYYPAAPLHQCRAQAEFIAVQEQGYIQD